MAFDNLRLFLIGCFEDEDIPKSLIWMVALLTGPDPHDVTRLAGFLYWRGTRGALENVGASVTFDDEPLESATPLDKLVLFDTTWVTLRTLLTSDDLIKWDDDSVAVVSWTSRIW